MTTKTDVFRALMKLTGNKHTHTHICCVGEKRIRCPEKNQPESVRLDSGNWKAELDQVLELRGGDVWLEMEGLSSA